MQSFIRYTYISIFTKFNMAAVRYLVFVKESRGATHEGQLMVESPIPPVTRTWLSQTDRASAAHTIR